MNLTIEEFKSLIELLEKPYPVKIESLNQSITILVDCKKNSDILLRPLQIEKIVINTLGIYDIQGIKVWVVKK